MMLYIPMESEVCNLENLIYQSINFEKKQQLYIMFAFNQIWLRSKCTKLRTYDFLKMYKLIKKVMCVSDIKKSL